MILKKGKGKKLIVYDKRQLLKLISQTIDEKGPECDLNFIDTSRITNMSRLFLCAEFNGNISEWDVRNVRYARSMFSESSFNGDISKWRFESAQDISYMFWRSRFSGDVSEWEVNEEANMLGVFTGSPLENNLPEWYLRWQY